jgi:hypothetical protein
MRATKTTAPMLAVGMLGVGALIFATPSAYAQPVTSSASNEDNDVVVQENDAAIFQASSIDCEAEAESENDDSVQVGDNTNVAANDCDSIQTAAIVQGNSNVDNDVQVASSDLCQQIALLGEQAC